MVNGVIGAVNRPFDIAYHGVDPSEGCQWNSVRAATGDDADVLASCTGDSGKAGQPIRDHEAIGAKMALGPLGDLFGAETVDDIHGHGNRMPLVVD